MQLCLFDGRLALRAGPILLVDPQRAHRRRERLIGAEVLAVVGRTIYADAGAAGGWVDTSDWQPYRDTGACWAPCNPDRG